MSDQVSLSSRPRRLFIPAPSVAAVLVQLEGSALPATPGPWSRRSTCGNAVYATALAGTSVASILVPGEVSSATATHCPEAPPSRRRAC